MISTQWHLKRLFICLCYKNTRCSNARVEKFQNEFKIANLLRFASAAPPEPLSQDVDKIANADKKNAADYNQDDKHRCSGRECHTTRRAMQDAAVASPCRTREGFSAFGRGPLQSEVHRIED